MIWDSRGEAVPGRPGGGERAISDDKGIPLKKKMNKPKN